MMKKWLVVIIVLAFFLVPIPRYPSGCGPMEDCPNPWLIWGPSVGQIILNYVNPNGQTPDEMSPPVGSFVPDDCGIQECHGPNFSCGGNIPEACDLMYTIGDYCSKFAHCQVVNGECGLVPNPDLARCQTCAQTCSDQAVNDPTFDSESCMNSCMLQ